MIVITERPNQLRRYGNLVRLFDNTDRALGFFFLIPVCGRNGHSHQRLIHPAAKYYGNTLLT